MSSGEKEETDKLLEAIAENEKARAWLKANWPTGAKGKEIQKKSKKLFRQIQREEALLCGYAYMAVRFLKDSRCEERDALSLADQLTFDRCTFLSIAAEKRRDALQNELVSFFVDVLTSVIKSNIRKTECCGECKKEGGGK